MTETNLAHGTMHLHGSAKPPNEQVIAENGNSFSNLAKGLFVGSVLGALGALMFVRRSVADLHQRRYRPPSTTRVENMTETGESVKSSIGWRVMFYFASAVAMFADLRIKKRQLNSHV